MGALEIIDAVARELMLFAGVGLLVGGVDELLVDIWFWADRLLRPRRRLTLATLTPSPPTRFAIFVPAWDEATVIGAMLGEAQRRFGDADYRIYLGTYPNDPATRAAAEAVGGDRLRIVVAPRPGPCSWTGKWEGDRAGFPGIGRDGVGRKWPESAIQGRCKGRSRFLAGSTADFPVRRGPWVSDRGAGCLISQFSDPTASQIILSPFRLALCLLPLWSAAVRLGF